MEPDQAILEKVCDSIATLVSSNGSWQEKKDALLSFASANGYQGDLDEFLDWFEIEEPTT